jgi:glycine/D-amino acid oxidase-like deaminating enzyme
MRIAVLGGGLTGVCAALELAERGCVVDLYEQDAALISRASCWNEGKIHLGFVYAMGQSRKTAATMIAGALRFRPLLERWVEKKLLSDAVSDPFLYAVHRDTGVPPEGIEAHFQAVADLCDGLRHQSGSAYIGPLEAGIWRRQNKTETDAIFNGEEICAVYETAERSIEAPVIAAQLSIAVAAMPNLNALTSTTVRRVEPERHSGYTVFSERDGDEHSERYDAVINALWQNRMEIDDTVGFGDDRPVTHRFKVGLFGDGAALDPVLPTVTFVHGPFGDTVNFGDRVYLSWYPAGLLSTSTKRVPGMDDAEVLDCDLDRIEAATLAAIGRLLPQHESALRESAGRWQAAGGYITAWGSTGIEDPCSQLHDRFEVGVHSRGDYHSIDTGKYTLAPHFANLACERVATSLPKVRVVA